MKRVPFFDALCCLRNQTCPSFICCFEHPISVLAIIRGDEALYVKCILVSIRELTSELQRPQPALPGPPWPDFKKNSGRN